MKSISTFSGFYKQIKRIDFADLPGLEAQIMMAPTNRRDDIRSRGEGGSPLLSGVLFLFYPMADGSTGTVFIQRPKYNGVHSGQISFPGGRFEEEDDLLEHTALRETQEEIGVDPKQIEIFGKLTDLYIPPSNHLVSPFIGVMQHTPSFTPDPVEVDEVIPLALSGFFSTECIRELPIKLANGSRLQTPCYYINGLVIWGATAMMIYEFMQLLEDKVRV